MKKSIALLAALCILAALPTTAQTILSEDFASNIPAGWTQNTTTGITWAQTSSFGSSGSGCAMADHSASTATGNGWLQAPAVNLTTISSPAIAFTMGLVGVSGTAPNISLWYTTGSSWNFLTAWGSGTGTTAATQTFDPSPPLNAANITWVKL